MAVAKEADERALERLDPFELKDRLLAHAAHSARRAGRTLLNAGRGNPDWIALTPREAFVLLADFALQESRRAGLPDAPPDAHGDRQLGGLPRQRGSARRLRAYLRARQRIATDLPGAAAGARLLAQALRYATRVLGFDGDAFVHELADGAAGGQYPEPPRMLAHAERVVRAYLEQVLCGGRASRLDLFAVEGATAGICYLFDSLMVNGLLHRGDRVAVAVPIFSPYLEILRLPRYRFRVVRIEASERRPDGSHAWQVPDAEIDKLADRSIKALVLVNPSNPPSVALRPGTVDRLVRLVRTRRPDLIVVSDDVYATFVPGFRSVLARLPRNTVCLYSFSKYFGCTGWRLGVLAIGRGNLLDRALAARTAPRRYDALALQPRKLKLIDRIVADSRSVALNHTAGLSGPQQVQMALLALYALLDRRGGYQRLAQAVIQGRLRALYRGLGVELPEDPLRAGYYCELDLLVWAQSHYGRAFVDFLRREKRPIDLVLRLAREASTVLMPCAAFGGPAWSVRVSLANLPRAACARIGEALHAAARDYVREWQARCAKPSLMKRPAARIQLLARSSKRPAANSRIRRSTPR